MKFFCIINNLINNNFIITIDGIHITEYNYCNNKLFFNLSLQKGNHVLQIDFPRNGRKIKVNKEKTLARTNVNFFTFKKPLICLSYNLEFKINKDSQLVMQGILINRAIENSEINYLLIKDIKHKGLFIVKEIHDFSFLKKEGIKLIILNNSIGLAVCAMSVFLCLLNCFTGDFMDYIIPSIFFLIASIALLGKMIVTLFEWQFETKDLGKTGDGSVS